MTARWDVDRVIDESPMSSGERATFLGLTLGAIGAVSAFLIFVPWYHPENPSLGLVVFIPLARKNSHAWILWPHLVVAGFLTAAFALGSAWHGFSLGLVLVSSVMIALPLMIVASELLRFPPPWEPQRYAERRAQLNDILGPGPWRGPERRRADQPTTRPAVERRRTISPAASASLTRPGFTENLNTQL